MYDASFANADCTNPECIKTITHRMYPSNPLHIMHAPDLLNIRHHVLISLEDFDDYNYLGLLRRDFISSANVNLPSSQFCGVSIIFGTLKNSSHVTI